MSLDELISGLENMRGDPAITRLAATLRDWKSDDTTVNDLQRVIERFIGHSWIENDALHEQTYALWSEFKAQAIDHIGGMTMNERLYSFGLFGRFDACESDADRLVVYQKLLAAP